MRRTTDNHNHLGVSTDPILRVKKASSANSTGTAELGIGLGHSFGALTSRRAPRRGTFAPDAVASHTPAQWPSTCSAL
jgi:hypothetical protein